MFCVSFEYRYFALFLYAGKGFLFCLCSLPCFSSSKRGVVAGAGYKGGPAPPPLIVHIFYIFFIQNAVTWQQSRSVVTSPGHLLGIRFPLWFPLHREAGSYIHFLHWEIALRFPNPLKITSSHTFISFAADGSSPGVPHLRDSFFSYRFPLV